MEQAEREFLERIAELVRELPVETVMKLSQELEASDDLEPLMLGQRILATLPSQTARRQVWQFVQRWKEAASTVSSSQLAWALRSACVVEQRHREQQKLELVWTGPVAGGVSLRRTDQALLEVVARAERTLTLVTFAATELTVLQGALVEALDRGVQIRLILESKKESGGKLSADASSSFGAGLRARVRVLVWPAEQRPKDVQGQTGVLHAKCAVADGRWLFVSSANLTGHAQHLNMELGILVYGGEMPGRAERLLDGLVEAGVVRE